MELDDRLKLGSKLRISTLPCRSQQFVTETDLSILSSHSFWLSMFEQMWIRCILFQYGRVSLHKTSEYSSDLLKWEHMAVDEQTDLFLFLFLGEEVGWNAVDMTLQLTEMTKGLFGIAYLQPVLGVDAVLDRWQMQTHHYQGR